MDAKLSAEFDAHIQAALAGRGAVVVIEGPPGSGKSTTLSTIAELAGGRGMVVWECVELAVAAEVPLGGLADRVQAALHDLPSQAAANLSRGVSSLRDLDGLSRLVQRFAERRPLALLMDDLQHTDAKTVAFLAHATRWVSRFPLLLVAAHIPAERLNRLGIAVTDRVALQAWSTKRVEEVVNEAGGRSKVADASLLLADLRSRALGHAISVVHLTRHWQALRDDAEWTVPERLVGWAGRHLTQLGPEPREALEAVATCPDGVAAALLPRVTGQDEPGALDTLLVAGWLRADEGPLGPRVQLRVPLVREALYAAMSPIRRQRWHARIVSALEDNGAPHAELAWHYRGAGASAPPARALEVLVSALSEGGDDRELQPLRETSVAIARRLRVPELGRLLEELGDACFRLADLVGAEAAWAEAVTVTDEPDAQARMRALLGRVYFERGEPELGLEHLRAGLEATADAAPSRAIVELLRVNCSLLERAYRYDELPAAMDRLQRLSLATGNDTAQLDLISCRFALEMIAGRLDEAWQIAREFEPFAFADLGPVAMRASRGLMIGATNTGHFVAMESWWRSLEYPRETMDAVTRLEFLVGDAMWDFWFGHWRHLRSKLDTVLSTLAKAGRDRHLFTMGAYAVFVDAHRGDLVSAREHLARMGRFALNPADRRPVFALAWAKAVLAYKEGDAEQAATLLEPEVGVGEDGRVLAPWPVLALSDLHVYHYDAGNLNQARRLLPLIEVRGGYGAESASYLRGRMARREGRLEEALPLLRQAAKGLTQRRVGLASAQAWLELAEAALEAGSAEASEAAKQALKHAQELDAPPYLQRVRRVLRALGLPTRAPRQAPTGGPLSARELEIGRLVARGRTNKEVAAELFVSPGTVGTHLKRIYRRLGIHSRAELTRFILDQGLARS